MGLSIRVFVDSLTTLNVVSEDDLTLVTSVASPGDPEGDSEQVARRLVEQGVLTKFQAANIYQGRGRGLVFSDYVVLDKIGSGGMGKVYKARDRRDDRVVALKVLLPHAVASPKKLQRFLREVEVASKLDHPNVVAAYDSGEAHGMHFFAMELVDGCDLSSYLEQNGPLPIAKAIDVLLQTARGLQYAHELGIVHRDVKPANILIDGEGRVKILDLGLARVFRASEEAAESGILTVEGEVMGTVDYMAPEQSQDTHSADDRADIYSLGCTLYRLLTGNPPYPGETSVMKIMAHHDRPIPSLVEALPEVPPQLDTLYRRMMAKRPEDRPQTMAEVVTALEAMV